MIRLFIIENRGYCWQQKNDRRRIKDMIRRSLKTYKENAVEKGRIYVPNKNDLPLYCLLNNGWRLREIEKGKSYLIESN